MTETAERTKYTEQQIEAHCRDMEATAEKVGPGVCSVAVQIIRQLQAKQAELLLHDIFGPPTIADLKAENEVLREQLRAQVDSGN